MIRKDCKEFESGLVDLAEGREHPEAARHVEACDRCSQALDELRVVLKAARYPFLAPPDPLVERAKAIMPRARPRLVARLFGSSLSASMARRSVAADFQLVVGQGGDRLRLMYCRRPGGWEVSGRLPSPDWEVAHEGRRVEVDAQGRFAITVRSLAESDLVLSSEDRDLVVPPAEELLALGPERAD